MLKFGLVSDMFGRIFFYSDLVGTRELGALFPGQENMAGGENY
jgi:hypothetical protein